MRKGNKNNDCIRQFFFSMSVDTCSREYNDAGAYVLTCRIWMCCALFASRGMHTHVLWYCRELCRGLTQKRQHFIEEVIIFVFFTHKKYSRSFIKLRLNHRCHMDYFNNVLNTLLGLEHVSSVAFYAGSESSRISSKIS